MISWNSLNALDPDRSIREADIPLTSPKDRVLT